MADRIADDYGARVINTLTGFKYIGEQIGVLEQNHKEGDFIFGFEESFGYLPEVFVRDKDAVSTSMLICEMGAFYKKISPRCLKNWRSSIKSTDSGNINCCHSHLQAPTA